MKSLLGFKFGKIVQFKEVNKEIRFDPIYYQKNFSKILFFIFRKEKFGITRLSDGHAALHKVVQASIQYTQFPTSGRVVMSSDKVRITRCHAANNRYELCTQ